MVRPDHGLDAVVAFTAGSGFKAHAKGLGSIANTDYMDRPDFSDTATATESVLSDYTIINDIETVFNTIQTDRTDTQIWKWFVIFTLLFIALELLIQKFVK